MTETKKNPIGRFIENTLVPISTAFAQNRYVRCIGTGSQNLMAIIMIGAVFNLLNSIQIDPYQSFIQATGIAAFLNAVYNACMNFMGVFMVFSVGYAGAKIFDHDELAFNNGLMSLVAYLIMVPVATNEAGSSVVVLDYLGSHGVFLAFILGIMATKINIALVERNITIKMPAGVPENVTQCFTSIIPGAAIALVSSLLRGPVHPDPLGQRHRRRLRPAPDPSGQHHRQPGWLHHSSAAGPDPLVLRRPRLLHRAGHPLPPVVYLPA